MHHNLLSLSLDILMLCLFIPHGCLVFPFFLYFLFASLSSPALFACILFCMITVQGEKERRVGWKRKYRKKETTKHTTITFFEEDCLFFLLSSSWQTEPSNPYLYLKATKGRKKYSSKLLQQAFILTKQKVGVKHSDGDDSRVRGSDIKNTEKLLFFFFSNKLCNVLQHGFFSRCWTEFCW